MIVTWSIEGSDRIETVNQMVSGTSAIRGETLQPPVMHAVLG